MRTMKLFLAAIFLTLMTINISDAKSIVRDDTKAEKIKKVKKQKGDDNEKRNNVDARIEKMKKELNLNAQQTEQLRTALTEHLQNLRNIKDQRKADKNKEVAKEKRKVEKEQFRAKLATILTPEQMEKMKNFDKDDDGEHNGKGNGKAKGKGKNKMK